MKTFKFILIVIGFVVIMGVVGESDRVSLTMAAGAAPFRQLAMLAIGGIVVLLAGVFLPERRRLNWRKKF